MCKQKVYIWLIAAAGVLPVLIGKAPAQFMLPPVDGSGGKLSLTSEKTLKVIDFEERQLHYNPIPMGWWKITDQQEQSFPHYAGGQLDATFAHSGAYSFMLDSDGGSVAFRYDRRRIEAKPGNDFQIQCYVHLENAPHCRAQLRSSLTNRRGEIIPGSERFSQLAGIADQDDDGWASVEVYVPGNHAEAQYITFSLWLLQKEQWDTSRAGTAEIQQRDVHARAWFDDVSLVQLPRVRLFTQQPGNVFGGNIDPKIEIEVEGVGTLDFQLQVEVYHADGRKMHDERRVLTGVEGTLNRYTISPPDLEAGLYQVRLSIFAGQRRIAERRLGFAKLAPLRSVGTNFQQFGILALDEDSGDWDTTAALTRLSNAGTLALPVWSRSPEAISLLNQEHIDQKLLQLDKSNIGLVAVFSHIPPALEGLFDPDKHNMIDVFSHDPRVWQPQVAIVLARFAQLIPNWEIADLERPALSHWDERIPGVVGDLQKEFIKFVKDPQVSISLDGLVDASAAQLGTDSLTVLIPPEIRPDAISDYLRDFARQGIERLGCILQPLPQAGYSRRMQLADFARRIGYAKQGNAGTILIEHPWHTLRDHAQQVQEPSELLAVFRTFSDLLGRADYLGTFEVTHGVPVLLFERDGQGIMMLWDGQAAVDEAGKPKVVSLYVGPDARRFDIFGNELPLDKQNGQADIPVDYMPVLLSQVDSRVGQFRSTLQLQPTRVEAVVQSQNITLSFSNPFSMPISGRLRFAEQGDQQWTIRPSSIPFMLDAGASRTETITLKLQRNAIAGQRALPLEVRLEADRSYTFHTELPFEIRLSDIDVNYFARPYNATDLLIQKVVTNRSDKPLNLISFVDLPNGERIERAISRLTPGAFIIRNYTIPNARQWLGQSLRVGVYDPRGPQRINYQLDIN